MHCNNVSALTVIALSVIGPSKSQLHLCDIIRNCNGQYRNSRAYYSRLEAQCICLQVRHELGLRLFWRVNYVQLVHGCGFGSKKSVVKF